MLVLETRHEVGLLRLEKQTQGHDNHSPVMQTTIILRTLMRYASRRRKKCTREQTQICTHALDDSYVSPVQWCLQSFHAPSLLAYAQQHRWVYGGMGAASLETELLWVGGPIAIQRTSTWSMSDMPCEDIPGEHIVCVF